MNDMPSVKVIAMLQGRQSLPALTPQYVWHPGLAQDIAALSEEELAGNHPDGKLSAPAWKAALHLWNDDLEAAHELVQELHSATGSALHGIVHRREGDYDNAKYWFMRSGDHPAYHGLQARAATLLEKEPSSSGTIGQALNAIRHQGSWNPSLFANTIEIHETRTNGDDSALRSLLERLQQQELEAMLRFIGGRVAGGQDEPL
ncbi:hypothetical protein [Cohnella yongneupensis]|uniref:Uncharacterized protein n=1 Tax=Cohnella yongneupensis TaxID=425006 RepID=A0ABW0QYF0_9BACL